jgi:hypothetical protein
MNDFVHISDSIFETKGSFRNNIYQKNKLLSELAEILKYVLYPSPL